MQNNKKYPKKPTTRRSLDTLTFLELWPRLGEDAQRKIHAALIGNSTIKTTHTLYCWARGLRTPSVPYQEKISQAINSATLLNTTPLTLFPRKQ